MPLSRTLPFLLLACLLLLTTQVSAQCATNKITNTFTPSLIGGVADICPVGWINTGTKCEKFADQWKAKLGSGCTTSLDCKFLSLSCINNVCSPLHRMEGDTCSADSQCTPNVNAKYGITCFEGRCRRITVAKTAKIGESCNVKNAADNTISDCAEGYCALKDLFNIPGLASKCVKTSVAKKGETCGFKIAGIPPQVTDYITCESGTTCSLTGTCVSMIQEGQACSQTDLTQQCQTNTFCRRKVAGASTTCEYKAAIGQYCDSIVDCAFANSGMISCENNKCVRLASRPNGQACTSTDAHMCYSRYCDSTSGKCAPYAGKETCSTSALCTSGSSQGCACAGKETDSNLGKCIASCEGQYYDLRACLYNLGLYTFEFITPSQLIGYTQYSDETSTAFRSCRYYYDRFYSCLKQTWSDSGISTTDSSMPGVGMGGGLGDGNSALLPERNGVESLNTGVFKSFSLIMVLMFALTVMI
ncbi:hypothetical protein C9374_009582 [Naegleria lovaniensis]|uniref:Uncharacterized protein n=1 Tax=Naegleria lovaniensis TaxID=51637 RepID=A0AA88GXV9_NAELO|nr:uncharacterized protein C9374_009582 [Naegleria lovaniensis]KAG2393005.1 hypothetical protein C9374_009582 [Naegleria lovaniensis]